MMRCTSMHHSVLLHRVLVQMVHSGLVHAACTMLLLVRTGYGMLLLLMVHRTARAVVRVLHTSRRMVHTVVGHVRRQRR